MNRSLQQFFGPPMGAEGDLDFKTGIPWPAPIPDDTSGLGVYGAYPLTMNRSQLARLWFTAKELTIEAPTGTYIVTVPNLFVETGVPTGGFGVDERNPFKATGGSFCFPLAYILFNDDFGMGGTSLGFRLKICAAIGPFAGTIHLQADGENNYYPQLEFFDFTGSGDSTATFSTYLYPDGGTAGTLNFIGTGVTAEIRGLDHDGHPAVDYGDVNVTITDTW